MKAELTVVILTYNESIHIERAIKNITGWADNIIVLDSHSTDDTAEKAKALGAEVIFRKFDNYKNQREHAISYVKEKTEWLLFLDADEYPSEELKKEIKEGIKNKNVNGYYVALRFIFMKRWIKWGGYYPTYLIRLFRPMNAQLKRTVNEYVFLDGEKRYLKNNIIHEDLKGIGSWIEKHNRYATFEAKELFDFKLNKPKEKIKFWTNQSERKHWIRCNIWNNLPIVVARPALYFIYRYFIRLGFLDGRQGLVYHFLQAFWFWLLIDLKYLEMNINNK